MGYEPQNHLPKFSLIHYLRYSIRYYQCAEQSSQRYYSLSAQIQRESQDYYRLLEATQKGSMDVTEKVGYEFSGGPFNFGIRSFAASSLGLVSNFTATDSAHCARTGSALAK